LKSYEQYFVYPTELNTLYESGAIIVPDTNFLLAAYQWRDITTDKVKKVLKDLSDKGRLKIPEQVLYEFSRNRQKVLFDQITSIEDEIKRFNDPKRNIREFMPTEESSFEIKEAQEKRGNLSEAINEYKNSLKKVKKKIESLIQHDEYFDFIKSLCEKSFLPYSKNKELLIEEGLKRISRGIKPGTHENKNDPTGDYIIWSEIMSLNENIIFVSNDQKKDWVYKGKNSQGLGTDQLLLAEFHYKTNGKSFMHVLPSKFVKYLDPKLDEVIEDDLEKVTDVTSSIVEYAIPSSELKFGDEKGEINTYWEFRVNHLPTKDDLIDINDIFESLGAENKNFIIMYDENEKDYSILVDDTDVKLLEVPYKEVYEAIHKRIGNELIRARYYPSFDRFHGYINEQQTIFN